MAAVQVDFAKKTANVTMKPGEVLTSEACAKGFAGTQYTIARFTEVGPAVPAD